MRPTCKRMLFVAMAMWYNSNSQATRVSRADVHCVPGTNSVHWATPDEVPEPNAGQQLSIVLPTVLDDWPRVAVLLAGLHLFLDQSAVHAFYWITPQHDQLVLYQQPPVGFSFPHVLLAEEQLLNHAFGGYFNGTSYFAGGYKTQMIVKLLVGRVVKTNFYLVLDSDIMPLKPFGTQEMFINDRATYTNFKSHENWYEASAKLGHFDASTKCSHQSIGEFGATPATLNKHVSEKTIHHMQHIYGSHWLEPVFEAGHLGWTEFTLYHLTACTYDMMDMYHDAGGRWVFVRYFGDLDWEMDHLFGHTNDAIFAIFQDAIDGMSVRNVIAKLYHKICKHHWEV